MKIGVLTYHIDINPGATLQCYATCRALKELGHEVSIIDLEHHNGNPNSFLAIVARIFQYGSMKRQKKFIAEHFPPYTRHYNDIEELRINPPQLDAYCVGSDQVWNLQIAGQSHMAYFLDFGDVNIYRFSYASSIGLGEWPITDEKVNKHIKELLCSFDGLAVREPTAQRILKERFGLDANVVCDPVLLHKDYKELINESEYSDEIACYLFRRPQELLYELRNIAKKMDKPIRMVTSLKPIKGFRHTVRKDVPSWLSYMTNSAFNITDSFHGTVVSLLYHRPFAVVYKDDGRSSRISDLLKIAGLSDCLFFDVESFKKSRIWLKSIDWNEVDERLDTYRNESWNYLYENVSKISDNTN